MKFTSIFMNRLLVLVAFFSSTIYVWAFDASKVADGLYYNGTNVGEQLWTPLFLAEQGKLIDPFLFAQKNGVKALEGKGKTDLVYATTPFLYGGCEVKSLRLLINPSLLLNLSTPYIAEFYGRDCQRQQHNAFQYYRVPRERRGSNPFPTFYINQGAGLGMGLLWAYGVPGELLGKPLPVNAYGEAEIGGRPEVVNGVVTRMTFIPMPVIEPDLISIALANKTPLPKYPVGVLEAAHRSTDVVVPSALLNEIQIKLKNRLWPNYYPRLEQALKDKFGGAKESYFELGLIQGIDLDNLTSFDYAGVARIGVTTKNGTLRWVDIVYCWRKKDDSLSIVATSEDALYKDENLFFSEKTPAPFPPTLTISGFSDFDKDKQLEIITSLSRPLALAYSTSGATTTTPINLRQNTLYAWQKSSGSSLTWEPVFQTVEHEARRVYENPAKVRIERFGQ